MAAVATRLKKVGPGMRAVAKAQARSASSGASNSAMRFDDSAPTARKRYNDRSRSTLAAPQAASASCLGVHLAASRRTQSPAAKVRDWKVPRPSSGWAKAPIRCNAVAKFIAEKSRPRQSQNSKTAVAEVRRASSALSAISTLLKRRPAGWMRLSTAQARPCLGADTAPSAPTPKSAAAEPASVKAARASSRLKRMAARALLIEFGSVWFVLTSTAILDPPRSEPSSASRHRAASHASTMTNANS
mmetsp:Transcript_24927/g.83752  ORF Transcript_24927/g.83752 Transcript_24927/m.83752 type:complete len:245 (+) Transcript_24927:178-912(+)